MNQDDSNEAGRNNEGPGEKGGPGNGNDKSFEIRIDRKEYKVRKPTQTGAELRKVANPDIGADRDLFEVVPGGSDLKIELATIVEMRDGLRFFTAPAQINPGT
jgi:Multiubiquitin